MVSNLSAEDFKVLADRCPPAPAELVREILTEA